MKSVAWSMITIGIFIGVWQLGARMSTDAVSMGVGLVFGVMAGIPVALMIMLAGGTGRMGESPNAAYARGWADGEYAAQLEMLRLGTKPAWMVEAEQERERQTITVKPMHVHPSQAPRRLEGGQR